MSILTRQQIIDTSHGSLAVEESGQGQIPVLLIHGNSFCRGVLRHQLQGSLAKNHRLIAFDLPGSVITVRRRSQFVACRLLGSWPETGLEEINAISSKPTSGPE